MGEFLVSRKVLSRDRLEDALAREDETGVPLTKILAANGMVGERDLAAAIADQLRLPFWDPGATPVLITVSGLIPRVAARRYTAVAVSIDDGNLVVAMEDPTDQEAATALSQATGWPVTPALAARADIVAAMVAMYGAEEVLQSDEVVAAVAPTPKVPHLNALLTEMLTFGASDLHLSAGLPPCIRVDGSIRRMEGYDPLNGSELRDLIYGVLAERQREKFEAELELDTSHSVPEVGRFRLNVFLQKDSVGAVLRAIPKDIVPLHQLGIPASVAGLAELPRGLILVTGPTGSGKSTTLASIIDVINRTRAEHIMTVEDPIEFVHSSKRCVVNQREVGEDTRSFTEALRHVLRQDPDVVLVGEMRDHETIATALTAAETGHLVLGTLHTQDAPQSIDRVIDMFSSEQQHQVRVQLASVLQGVICQQLLAKKGGSGRVVAVEVLIATPAVRNLIREGKIHQLYSVMQSGGKYGMRTMDASLAELVARQDITVESAIERCHDEEDLRRLAASSL